jgi:hypothetical protein
LKALCTYLKLSGVIESFPWLVKVLMPARTPFKTKKSFEHREPYKFHQTSEQNELRNLKADLNSKIYAQTSKDFLPITQPIFKPNSKASPSFSPPC